MNTCQHCGSNKFNGGYECGTMMTMEGDVQTRFCSYVAEFRKPLDAELQSAKSHSNAIETDLQDATKQLHAWKMYAVRLERAGDAMFNAVWDCQDWSGTRVGQCSDVWLKEKESKP